MVITMEKKQNNFLYVLRISLVLLIICSLTAAAVALVYAVTYEKADENQKMVQQQAIETIFGEGIEIESADISSELQAAFTVTKDGEQIGVCALVRGAGFGGDMDVMVGFVPDGSAIVGVQVVSHSETPGLGSRVSESEYLAKYVGKSGNLTLDTDIDAISGSTISSRALLDAVNTAEKELFGREGDN